MDYEVKGIPSPTFGHDPVALSSEQSKAPSTRYMWLYTLQSSTLLIDPLNNTTK